MRRCFVELLIVSLAAGTLCEGSPSPFQNAEIVWSVPANDWPEKLWTYKVYPQEFSPAVISNLLALGGFIEKDRTQAPEYFRSRDTKSIFYGNLGGTARHLAISPTLGLVEYHDGKAEASSQLQIVEGVPNEQETTKLGLKYLRLLGIDISQIARKPANGELDLRWQKGTIGYTDQGTKKEVTLTNNYGVMFSRWVDGIKVHGFGGMDIKFGNNAKVVDLHLGWRDLQPYELRECPTLQEITEQIKNGKVTLHPLGTTSTYSTEKVQQLTITKATPLYEGKQQSEPMDYVRPYANLQGIADDGQTKTGVWFEYSLVKTN